MENTKGQDVAIGNLRETLLEYDTASSNVSARNGSNIAMENTKGQDVAIGRNEKGINTR
jgi:hypothetical protein